MRLFFLVFLFLISGISSFAQVLNYGIDLNGFAQVYSGADSPFWLHSGRNGWLDEQSNLSVLLQPKLNFEIDRFSIYEMGAGLMFKNGHENSFGIDEAYFTYKNGIFGVTVGKRHQPVLYNNLSASGRNILISNNAPAPPGILFFTPTPLFFNGDNGIGVMGSFGEYLFDDDRYVDDTRLHHKSLHLVYENETNLKLKFGIQHFVQWAGTSPTEGELPHSFNDYLKILFADPSEDVGDQEVNALGNQIGSYEIELWSKINGLDVAFIYNHIFEDASGMKMGNFPDGRYSVYIEDNRDSFWGTPWLKAFLYEFYYTKNQSRSRKSSLRDGADNYFNSNLYRSGWTYRNRVIGTPFILLNDNRFRIGTNIVAVHHMGIKGEAFERIPYRLLLSYRQNYGVKDSFFPEKKTILSCLIELDIIQEEYNLRAYLGADLKSSTSSNFGIGLQFSKTLF